MKSSITTASAEALSFGPGAVLPLVIRTSAIRSLVKKTPTNERPLFAGGTKTRSEEHTSELQSRFDLVCRLLLEKKKNNLNYLRSSTIRMAARLTVSSINVRQ